MTNLMVGAAADPDGKPRPRLPLHHALAALQRLRETHGEVPRQAAPAWRTPAAKRAEIERLRLEIEARQTAGRESAGE